MINNKIMKDSFLNKSINDDIEGVFKNYKKNKNLTVITPESITQCSRRLFYRLQSKNISQPLTYNVLEDIDIHYRKRKWIDIIEQKSLLLKKFFTVSDNELNIVSNIDAVFKKNDLCFLCIIDILKDEDYCKYKNSQISKKQFLRIMIDLWLTDLNDAILICENSNDNNYFITHIERHNQILFALKEKCDEIMTNKILNKKPSRPYKDSKNKECCSCEFKVECWQLKGN